MDFITLFFSCLLSLIPLLVIIRRPDIKFSWVYIFHFAVLFMLTDMALGIGSNIQLHLFPQAHMNWVGKILGMAVSIVYYLIFLQHNISLEMAGIRFYVDRGSLRAIVIAGTILIAVKFCSNYYSSDKELASLEGYLYQATLPGLQEELLFRGFLLALLQLAFQKAAVKLLGFTLDMWIVSLLFALVHSFKLNSHYAVMFHPVDFGFSLATGMLYTWMRVKSGSLVMPTIFHNLGNVAILVANSIK